MMLPKLMSPFKLKVESQSQEGRRKLVMMSSIEGTTTTMDVVGLRLLSQITSSKSKSSNNNVLVKSAVKKPIQTSPPEFCFLQNCNLCNKQLRPDKDIYMYRGDQGFCSIECRDRQIVLDEMKELESSTKQMVASYSYGQCCNEARRETRLILEDLRMQRHKSRV